MSEKSRLFVLGAQDPEMVAIENLLRACGEKIAFACDKNHGRVHPGNAYKAAGALDDGDQFCQIPGEDEVVLVECRFDDRHPLQPGQVSVYTDPQAGGPVYFPSSGAEEYYGDQAVSVVDHHRPGDPGYGRDAEEFLPSSSVGQIVSLLVKEGGWPAERGWEYRPQRHNLRPAGEFYELPEDGQWVVAGASALGNYYGVVPNNLLFAAAADHCLGSAYRGKCPGVDPDGLMRWRVETRAAFQKRTVEAVLADVEAARKRLRYSVAQWTCPECGGSKFDPATGTETCHYCDGNGGGGPYEVARFDGMPIIPELPEAAAREGIPFVATVRDQDGREKVVLQAASPELVRRFLVGEIITGLTGLYGDPARGFAGGYVAK